MTDDVSKVVKSLEPEACLEMAREFRPIMSDVAMESYAKEFAAASEKAPHPQPLAPEYRGEGRTEPCGFDGDDRNRSD